MSYRISLILFISVFLLSAYTPPKTPLSSLPAGTPGPVKTGVAGLFSTDPDDLALALITLQEAGSQGINAAPFLMDLLDDTTDLRVQGLQTVSDEAARALIAIGPSIEASVARLLSSSKPPVRAKAAFILGQWSSSVGIDRLHIMALNESHPEVRINVIQSLGKIKNRSSIQPLLSLLSVKDEMAAQAVVNALAAFGYTAIKPLTYNLASPDTMKRANAARALGLIGDTLCLNDIKSLIHDKEAPIRLAAAEALGSIRLNDAIEPLITMLSDSDQKVSRQAVISLGRYPHDRIIIPLVEHLPEFDENTAIEAGNLIKEMEPSVTRDALNHGLQSQNPQTVRHILTLISETKWAGFTDRIIALISSGHPTGIKLQAMETLIALADKKAISVMQSAVKSPDKRISARAVSALLTFNDVSRETATLVEELLKDSDPQIRLMVAKALPFTDSYRLTPVMSDALSQSPYPEIKVFSLKSLGRMQYSKALPRISPLINDPNESVREAATEALVEIGDESAKDIFITYLTDDNPVIRSLCTRGLSRLNNTESIPLLIKTLDDEDAKVRTEAVSALGQLKAKEALNPVINIFYNDPEEKPRAAAIEAISLIDTSLTQSFIIDGLKSKNPVIKQAAISAASRYPKNKDIMSYLAGLLNHDLSSVRQSAQESLTKGSGKKYSTAEEWMKWSLSL